jgi:hypothetical protein
MSATKQLREELSSIDQAILWHNGDVRATIATLLEDCRYLREQLDTAKHCMSKGLTRGWTPSLDREQ